MISPVNKWTAERTGLYENLNPESLLAWQKEKLKETIQYAAKNTKFYSDKLKDGCELNQLPFTLPTDIANDPLAFLAVPLSKVVRVTTLANSGTTHLRKRIFFTKADLERTKDFFACGMSTIVNKGDRAQILISNRTENSLGSLLSESLSRIGVTSGITASIKTVHEAIEVSRDADCLIGMPAEIIYMCRTAPELRPRNVLLAADIAPQSMIDGIKENWKCRVYTHHGHTEFGYGCAVDCKHHKGYHLRDADFIFEIIDLQTGKPVMPEESGEIVITTLNNEAMPLIRYRTGNISQMITAPCGCGGLLPRLGRIEGRFGSNISVGNNKTLSIHQLDEIVFADKNVRGFEALLKVEGERNTLHLTVDACGFLDTATLVAKLPRGLHIEVKYGKTDPFAHRAKRRLHIG